MIARIAAGRAARGGRAWLFFNPERGPAATSAKATPASLLPSSRKTRNLRRFILGCAGCWSQLLRRRYFGGAGRRRGNHPRSANWRAGAGVGPCWALLSSLCLGAAQTQSSRRVLIVDGHRGAVAMVGAVGLDCCMATLDLGDAAGCCLS